MSEKNLTEYNKIWWKERGHALQKVEVLRKVIEKTPDEELNRLADVLEGNDIVSFTRGNKLFKLGKILIKNPRLMTLAKKLI